MFIFSLANISYAGENVKISGRVVDKLTGMPVSNAGILSAYEFLPTDFMTSSDGKFELTLNTDFILKEGPEKGNKNNSGNWNFFKQCYGYTQFELIKNYQENKNGRSAGFHELALLKKIFDDDIIVTGLGVGESSAISIGDFPMQPMASLSIKTKSPFYGVDLLYESKSDSKNAESLMGSGNYSSSYELTDSLPLDHSVFVVFLNENGSEEARSSIYSVPPDAQCKKIILEYDPENNLSEWYVKKDGFIESFLSWLKGLFR